VTIFASPRTEDIFSAGDIVAQIKRLTAFEAAVPGGHIGFLVPEKSGGNHSWPKREIWQIMSARLKKLADINIKADKVKHVIITHLHFSKKELATEGKLSYF